MKTDPARNEKRCLLASDFDQTLSFNDSGIVLSDLLGVANFHEKVAGVSETRLVQQGGELAYLLLHDPDYRHVRREHLWETGKQIRLKRNLPALTKLLANLSGYRFSFYVLSAAPEQVIQSALEGIVPADHIIGTRFRWDEGSGAITGIEQVTAGYGKVAALEELRMQLQVSPDRIVYVGDGSSDVHVMLHVHRREGLTIAVSESPFVTQIARRTMLSDDALSVVVPILEEVLGWEAAQVRALFESHGFTLQEWTKVRTDSLTIAGSGAAERSVAV
ncbi:MAG: haloacid dehalogenase-like hydrolase [Bryobacteraceae bacterium]|nr:haloacid dehalogenase-like hydrolase [Solibacteraceae bacterium]MCO5351773.1 haloacid dehalogenase-like hydrolase [Bryobacteraceae bacterium]